MTLMRNTYYRVKTKIVQKITNDRYVFELISPEKLDYRQIDGEKTYHFKRYDEIPAKIRETLPLHSNDLASTFDMGLRLVVLMVGDAFGSLVWTRLGKDFDWIVPVMPNDRMMGRGFTNPLMRGRALHGRCIAAMVQEKFDGQANGGRVFCDCHVNNDASIRQLLKTGAFKIVARVRPLEPNAMDRVYQRLGILRI